MPTKARHRCRICGALRHPDRTCDSCGAPTVQQNRNRRGTRAWKQHVAAAIAAEPWCHTPNCPYPDCGAATNPLVGDHDQRLTDGGELLGPITVRCMCSNAARQ